jgi:Tfp pilus assembly protein PilV
VRAAARDEGFTVVELMVGLTVLAIGIGGIVNVFNTSFSVASQGNNRSRAVSLATRDAEAMRAVPYDRLGFAPTQPGFLAGFEGSPTVIVAEPLIQPTGPSQTIGGMTYQFERHIVWADAASTSGFVQAYKRVAVMVSWTDQAGTHTARQDAFVYPGGRGLYKGPQEGMATTTTVASAGGAGAAPAPAAPLGLLASVPTDLSGSSTVNLDWTPSASSTPAVSTWVVQFSTDSFMNAHVVTDSQPAAVTTLSVAGLSPSTQYQFRVAAKSAAGVLSTWSVVASATTSAEAASVCELGTATMTPSAVKRQNGGSTVLSANAAVSVNASASCTGLKLRFKTTAAGGFTTVLMTAGTGGTWAGTVNGLTTAWDTGSHQVEVLDGSNTVLGTLAFTVCVHNAKKCP